MMAPIHATPVGSLPRTGQITDLVLARGIIVLVGWNGFDHRRRLS